MARCEGQRRALAPPAAAAAVRIARRGRERERTADLSALLMLLGSSVVVRSAAGRPTPSSPSGSGERALAGFLLWVLGLLLSSHRVRPFPGAAAKLRRFFTGRCFF